jgi:hypothetical protein
MSFSSRAVSMNALIALVILIDDDHSSCECIRFPNPWVRIPEPVGVTSGDERCLMDFSLADAHVNLLLLHLRSGNKEKIRTHYDFLRGHMAAYMLAEPEGVLIGQAAKFLNEGTGSTARFCPFCSKPVQKADSCFCSGCGARLP